MALFTVLALTGKSFIPPKTLLIHPTPSTWTSIYGPTGENEGEAAQWVDQERNEWLCDYKIVYGHSNCGMSFNWSWVKGWELPHGAYPDCERAESDDTGDGWGWENEQSCIVRPESRQAQVSVASSASGDAPYCSSGVSDRGEDGWAWENDQRCIIEGGTGTSSSPVFDHSRVNQAVYGMDFSGYDGIYVSIHYEGRANFINIYLRNFNPEYSDYRDLGSSKFMSAIVRTEDLKAGPAYVSLREFSVDEWWTLQHDLPRPLAAPEFDRVLNLGVDYTEHGMHRMRVDRIELVGERISTENFLMFLLLIWAGYLSLEGAFHYHRMRSASRQQALQINQLNSQTQILEKEKNTLQSRFFSDPLTEILNRAGLEYNLEQIRSSVDSHANLGLLVMDIDYFKQANDTYGHDWGDQALINFAKLIKNNTREDDIFARWGGEEFVLITRYSSQKTLAAMADKLRILVSEHTFEGADDTPLTISIGVTTLKEGDSFYTAFKRADNALYRAKGQRNRVVYDV